MYNILLYIFAIVIGIIIGIIATVEFHKIKAIGSFVLIDDPDTKESYIFLEINRGCLDELRKKSVVELKIEERKVQPPQK